MSTPTSQPLAYLPQLGQIAAPAILTLAFLNAATADQSAKYIQFTAGTGLGTLIFWGFYETYMLKIAGTDQFREWMYSTTGRTALGVSALGTVLLTMLWSVVSLRTSLAEAFALGIASNLVGIAAVLRALMLFAEQYIRLAFAIAVPAVFTAMMIHLDQVSSNQIGIVWWVLCSSSLLAACFLRFTWPIRPNSLRRSAGYEYGSSFKEPSGQASGHTNATSGSRILIQRPRLKKNELGGVPRLVSINAMQFLLTGWAIPFLAFCRFTSEVDRALGVSALVATAVTTLGLVLATRQQSFTRVRSKQSIQQGIFQGIVLSVVMTAVIGFSTAAYVVNLQLRGTVAWTAIIVSASISVVVSQAIPLSLIKIHYVTLGQEQQLRNSMAVTSLGLVSTLILLEPISPTVALLSGTTIVCGLVAFQQLRLRNLD